MSVRSKFLACDHLFAYQDNKAVVYLSVYAYVLSLFSCVWLFVTLWTIANHQALLSMGFPKQESWSGLSCPLPGVLDPGIELTSLMSPALAGGFYTTSATREAYIYIYTYTHICWKRKWRPTPVFFPGKSHGWRNLAGCSPWGSQRVGHDWVTNTHTHARSYGWVVLLYSRNQHHAVKQFSSNRKERIHHQIAHTVSDGVSWGEVSSLGHTGCCCCLLLSRVQLCATPWSVAPQAPLSMGFSRQEYWSGLPCPPPGDLPHPGIKPRSRHCRWILYCLSHQGSQGHIGTRLQTPSSQDTTVLTIICSALSLVQETGDK